MSELQAVVANAADTAGAHSTAPALLLQAMTALGAGFRATNEATGGGRRPFRIPHEWADQLSELAYLVYLMADQTAVDIDASVRAIAAAVAQTRPGPGPGPRPTGRRQLVLISGPERGHQLDAPSYRRIRAIRSSGASSGARRRPEPVCAGSAADRPASCGSALRPGLVGPGPARP